MPTSFVAIDGRLMDFAVGLASAARLFTTVQLACHPELSGRSMPARRAGEFLRLHADAFEHINGIWPYMHLWRLTAAEKRGRRLRYRNVSASQHTPHWLALGDLWMTLVFNGLRPEKWFTEGKAIGGFDVFAMIQARPYLIEVQLSPLTAREWNQKWRRRIDWLQHRKWRDVQWSVQFSEKIPRLLLVTRDEMKVSTPRGVTYIRRFSEVPKELRRLERM